MEGNRKYFAFISYKREDEKWAKWLKQMVEYYHLPSTLNGQSHPKNLRYVYRDVEGLASGELSPQIHDALEKSQNLIVICSPRVVANPTWVNKEIEYFAALKDENGEKKESRIFPFIIEGIPHAKNPEEECFPSALLAMTKDEDKLGGNVNEGGRDLAAVKLIAGMLGVGLMDLWNPYEREMKRKRRLWTSVIAAILAIAIGIALYIGNLNAHLSAQNRMLTIENIKVTSREILSLLAEGEFQDACKLLQPLLASWQDDYRMEAPIFEQVLRTTYRYTHPDGAMCLYTVPLSDQQFVMDADSDYIYIKSDEDRMNSKVLRYHLRTGELADTLFPANQHHKNRDVVDVKGRRILYKPVDSLMISPPTDLYLYDAVTKKDYHINKRFLTGMLLSDNYVIGYSDRFRQQMSSYNFQNGKLHHIEDIEIPIEDCQVSLLGDTLCFSNGERTLLRSLSKKAWIGDIEYPIRSAEEDNFKPSYLTPFNQDTRLMAFSHAERGLMMLSADNDSIMMIDPLAKEARVALNQWGDILAVNKNEVDSVAIYINQQPFVTIKAEKYSQLMFATETGLIVSSNKSLSFFLIEANYQIRPFYAADGYTYIDYEPQTLLVCNDTIDEPLFKLKLTDNSPIYASGFTPLGTYFWFRTDSLQYVLVDYQKREIKAATGKMSDYKNFYFPAAQMSEDENVIMQEGGGYYFYDIKKKRKFSYPKEGFFYRVYSSLSPDGSYVAMAKENMTVIRDTAHWEQPVAVVPSVSQCSATNCKFSSDGKQLLISYTDGSIRLWNISDMSLAAPVARGDEVVYIDISPDGQYALGTTETTEYNDSDVFLWHLPTGHLVDHFNTKWVRDIQQFYVEPFQCSFQASFARSGPSGIIMNDRFHNVSRVYDFPSFEDLLFAFHKYFERDA